MSHTLLERLKDEDQGGSIAKQLIQSMPGLNAGRKIQLNHLFSLTVSRNSEKRISDIGN